MVNRPTPVADEPRIKYIVRISPRSRGKCQLAALIDLATSWKAESR